MDVWASQVVGLLWRNALAVVPLAVLVAAICRCSRFRPATRHSLWLLVLLWFVAPLALPGLDFSAYWGASKPSDAGAPPGPAISPPAPNIAAWHTPPPAPSSAPDTPLATPDRNARPRPITAWRNNASPAGSPPSPHDNGAGSPGASPTGRVPDPVLGASSSPPRRDGSAEPPAARREDATPAIARPDDVSAASIFAPISGRLADDGIAALLEASKSPLAADCGSMESYSPQSGTTPHTESPPTPAAAAPVRAYAIWRSLRNSALDAWRSACATAAEWVAAFQAVRDRLGRVPAPPSAFWFGGLAGLLCVLAWRLMSFRSRLERGRPADAQILRVVCSVARGMGLRRTPETLVVADRVSPMIWCGRRARLILPHELWNDLDDTGRRAIVAHELAHLRRGDHWVCRLALLLSGLFWWHPVLWWVRRRLNEEADLACDAWVTWLMPRERRAYAEALLRTKAYLSDPRMNVPAAGIGIAGGRVRSMARRIKMVMTQTVRPRESMTGLALAVFLAAMGWAATPAWSFPGDEKCAKAAAGVACTAQGAGACSSTSSGGPAPAALLSVAQQAAGGAARPLNASSGTLALANLLDERARRSARAGASADGDDLQRRVERLERQLEELRGALHGGRGLGGAPAMATPPPAMNAPMPPTPPALPAPVAGLFGGAAGRGPGGAPRAASPFGGRAGGESSDEVVIHAYKLPDRKLDAIFALLGPDDVPLRVRKLDGAIEVHGTQREHEIFRAFIDIIHPDGAPTPSPTPQPRPRSRTSRRATGGSEAAPQAVAQDAYLAALAQAEQQAAGVERLAELAAIESADGAAQSAALAALLERAAAAEANSTGTHAQLEMLEHQLEALAHQSEAFQEQTETLRQRAAEAAERKAGDADRQLERELKEKARAMEQQTREVERQSRQLERQMRELERKAAEFERRAEELREKAESLGESSSESDDDSDGEADDEELSVEAPELPEPPEIPDAPDAAEPRTPAPPAAGWTTTPALAPLPAGPPAATVPAPIPAATLLPATAAPIATAPPTPGLLPTGR